MLGTHRILVVGPSQSGKTALVSGNRPETKKESVVYRFRRERPDGFVFVTDPHYYFSCRARFETADELLTFAWEDAPGDVYCLSFETELDWDVGFHFVWQMSGTGQKVALIVDELLQFSDARSGTKSFKQFYTYGRHRLIDLCFCSMRPINVDGLLRENLTEVYAFRQNHEDDIDALSKIGFIGERAEETRDLARFEYVHFSEADVFAEVSGRDADNKNKEEKPDGNAQRTSRSSPILDNDKTNEAAGGGKVGGRMGEKAIPGSAGAGGGVGE